MKLLIVDDSPLIRTRLSSLFTEWCQIEQIYLLGSLTGVKELIQTSCPEVMVLDLNFGEKNLLEMIPVFKQLARDMYIAVYTNEATEFCRKKCIDAGANTFIDKSDDVEHLIGSVNSHLAVIRADNPTAEICE